MIHVYPTPDADQSASRGRAAQGLW